MIGVSLAAAMPSADKAKTELSFSAAQDNSSLFSGQGDPFMALLLSLLKDWQAPAQPARAGEKKPAKDTRLDVAVEPVISHCTQTNPGDVPASGARHPCLTGQKGTSGLTTDSENAKTGRAMLLPGREPEKNSMLNSSAGASPSRIASIPLAQQGSAGASPSRIYTSQLGEISYCNPDVGASDLQSLALADSWDVKDANKSRDMDVASIEPISIAGYSEHAAQIDSPGHGKQVQSPHAAASNSIQDHLSVPLSQFREPGSHEVHLTLHPAELGPVHLHLKLDGDRVNIHFSVHGDDAKVALDQQLEPLRIRFTEMGLSLGQFDVRQDGSHRQQDDGSFLPVGPRGAVLTRKPYFQLAKSSGRVDVIA